MQSRQQYPGPRLSLFVVAIMGLLTYGKLLSAEVGATFVGSSQCGNCHHEQFGQWIQSDHFKAMGLATHENVLGNFLGQTIEFHGAKNRFYRIGEQYFVDIKEVGGEFESFEIKYTFGYYPLQQYLVELEDGFIQALNVAWDARPKEEGGQRWFHLQPTEEITPEHPFHWKSHFQNWNARCADCHSTNLVRNYDQQSHSYNSKWSEINVACEACHGPGSRHIELVNNNGYSDLDSGFSTNKPEYVKWVFSEGDPIANPVGEKDDRHINMCGNCHALHTQLSPITPMANFHDANRIRLIDEVAYFLDGQIREETYVLGSFMQSKMYENGVTCINCHNPHSGNLIVKGNSLCAQCHQPATYNSPDHHHHEINSVGAQCVNCHMLERTYMQVDNRRDHSFTIPQPKLSIDLGVPNACTSCHVGRQDKWALDTLTKWGIVADGDNPAYISQRAQSGDILVTRPLTNLIKMGDLPAILKASYIAQLSSIPSRVSVETAQQQLEDQNPLIRRGAVTALQALPAALRWELLSPYMDDPSRSVRYEIAANLSSSYTEFFPEQQKKLDVLLSEYREILAMSADSPATQLNIANLELALRNLIAAERAYLQALRIEPSYVPALLNLEDYYRALGRETDVAPLLNKALEVAPDNGAAHHSYGLHLIRLKNYTKAMPYLAKAIETSDAQPRYAYVYAVALESAGTIDQAIDVLESANAQWPNQYDLLMTLVIYMDKSGNTKSIYRYISALTAIAPNSPDVKRFVTKYTN